jgi:hypothetical protein
MVIELSYERFNNGDDIVPWYSAEEVILNTGFTNTLGGHDKITGVGPGRRPSIYDSGIINRGTLEMAEGNDMITGTYDDTEYSLHNANYARLRPNNGRSPYRDNRGNFYYYPDDSIPLPVNNYGIYNSGTIDTGEGNDTITGSNTSSNRGNGIGFIGLDSQDNIIIYNPDNIGIYNGGTIYTRGGNDSIISQGKFINYGNVYLGDDNDTITSYGVIYNDGEINTGFGDDSIIAHGGFESGLNNSGRVLLGPGEDSLSGFGNGTFNGGGGEDTLELTPGSYIVGRLGEAVTFTKGSSVMITSDFDKLRINSIFMGSTTYDFSSLINGQIISV